MEYPTLNYEQTYSAKGFNRIAGLDEAGVGTLAGPLVAAAVILDTTKASLLVADSKLLTSKQRESLYPQILKNCIEYGVGWVSVEEINTIQNIQKCGYLARFRAIQQIHPDFILSDHFDVPETNIPSLGVTKGDRKIVSVAAASILAKVTRDKYMEQLSSEFPEYGWSHNFGYCTKDHTDAIEKFGVTTHHKLYYNPIPTILQSRKAQNLPEFYAR